MSHYDKEGSQNQNRTCILCRSMTDAESLLIGRGVLLTTTRSIHCSNLRIIRFAKYSFQKQKNQARGEEEIKPKRTKSDGSSYTH
jgi:hypothetical protein